MKTLIATVFQYPHAGGLSSHVTSLKSGLENLGHQVDVLSIDHMPAPLYLGLIRGPSFLLNKISPGAGMVWSHQQRYRALVALIRKRLQGGVPGNQCPGCFCSPGGKKSGRAFGSARGADFAWLSDF
ncbi:MAG: hypothetical protein ACYCX4_04320 [Bacillota bacterium]